MTDGVLEGVFKGGYAVVYVAPGGVFNLSGGTIRGTSLSDIGCRQVSNNGTFTMTGGEIGASGKLYGTGVYNSGTMNLYGGTIYEEIEAYSSFNTKMSANILGTISLGDKASITVQDYSNQTPTYNIKISSKRSTGEIITFKGGTEKPDISKISISGYGENFYIDVYQENDDWVIGLKKYVLVTVSNLSETDNEGTVMGSDSGVWQKKCKVGEVINFTHEPNGNFEYSKFVHGRDWGSETIDESVPYTISDDTDEENFRFCYVVLLYLNTVTNGENGNGDGGLCTVYDGQTPKTEVYNGWAYYGPNQKTQCTAVPNYGYALEGVYDNSACSGTPISTEQSFEWAFGSYGYQRLYANFVNSPILLPETWKSQVESENYMTTTISYGDITNLKFTKSVPSGYAQIGTLSTGLKVYKNSSNMDIAFVYPTVIMAPENSSSLFQSVGAKTITFENFDTTNATNMSNMFLYSGVTSLDLSSFNTSKVTDMSHMFESSDLTRIDNISSLDTSKVTNMYMMFAGLRGLTSLDVSSFDTSQVTNMSYMFYYLSGLTSLNLGSFNTSQVTDMSYMFQNCAGLTSLNISSFNTKLVTTMECMFYNCSNITRIDVSGFNTMNVKTMKRMFQYCSRLTDLANSNVLQFNTSSVTDMYAMFDSCALLSNLDLRAFNTLKVTDMGHMFDACSNMKTLNCSGLNMTNVTNTTDMFKFSTSTVTNYIERFNTPYNNQYSLPITTGSTLYNSSTGEFAQIVPLRVASSLTYTTGEIANNNSYDFPTDWKSVLYDSFDINSAEITSLQFVSSIPAGFEKIGTFSNGLWIFKKPFTKDIAFVAKKIIAPTNCTELFQYLEKAKTIDMGVFDTENVTNMSHMFFNCSSLTSLSIEGFVTTKVKISMSMFGSCSSLTFLNLANFDLSSISKSDDCVNMFIDCSSLESFRAPNMSGSITANLPTVMYYEVQQATKKVYIPISSLSVETNGRYIFRTNPLVSETFIPSLQMKDEENIDFIVQDNKKEKLFYVQKIEG